MIEKLKMVNWKSHSNTELRFSPATNLLIGPMGSGKTSCLDAICFAFFGTFPSLKSRQVNLSEVVMSRPEKKQNGLVEVGFTSSGKEYCVTRTITGKGTEAFLRCGGALLEGPQPIRTTEAVSRVLKIDYETFVRVVYGEQNKLDYFLTLAKGSRKAQIDDLLGISLFEKVRLNANSLLSKLRSEKITLESFLAGVNIDALEGELEILRKSLQAGVEKVNSLESMAFSLNAELETACKNLESLEELKKINEELSMQLVKTQAEADSLHTSALSVMPASLYTLTREQCTALLEQSARALQERSDIDQQLNELNNSTQRLNGEYAVVKQIVDQFPLEAQRTEIAALTEEAKQLEIASQEFLELTKIETILKTTKASLQNELNSISAELAALAKSQSALNSIQGQFASIEQLGEIVKQKRAALLELERLASAKDEAIASLEKSISLLSAQQPLCPTCDQPLEIGTKNVLMQQKAKLLQTEKNAAVEIQSALVELRDSLEFLDSTLSTWVDLLPAISKSKTLKERQETASTALARATDEHAALVNLVAASKEKVDALKKKTQQLDTLKEKLGQVERSAEKLVQIEREVALLAEEVAKKQRALALFDDNKKLEARLEEVRSAIKAFELFEKTESLKTKAKTIRDKLVHLQFDEATLKLYRDKTSTLRSQLDSTRVSLGYTNTEVKEKSDLISKLDVQFSKLSTVKKNCSDIENAVHNVVVFQNSVIETQAELRAELIAAVNEAMHEVWKNIYPYRDYSSCHVVATEDDYSLEVLSSDGWKPVEQCSGGEKTCAALSLRVSLAMVLVPNLSWLVLDEPTHNLDAQGVNLLARALHETLPTIVRQTFVVTHDEALKEGASGTVHAFNRDKDKGEATLVETLA